MNYLWNNAAPSNKPSGISNWGCVRVIRSATNGIIQICYDRSGDYAIYHRAKEGNTWKEWMRDDNFGCNTPSDLASLLGVRFKNIGTVDNTYDLNDLANGVASWVWTKPPVNVPYSDNGCIYAITSDGGFIWQVSVIVATGNNGGIYMRWFYGSTWSSWSHVC